MIKLKINKTSTKGPIRKRGSSCDFQGKRGKKKKEGSPTTN
jgi:hypothetical protein